MVAGHHLLKYKGIMYWITRTRDSNATDMTSGGLFETLTITTLGRRLMLSDGGGQSKAPIERLIYDARSVSLKKDEGKIVVYTSHAGHWQ